MRRSGKTDKVLPIEADDEAAHGERHRDDHRRGPPVAAENGDRFVADGDRAQARIRGHHRVDVAGDGATGTAARNALDARRFEL